MSPEQARINQLWTSTHSDVYALSGSIPSELLSGLSLEPGSGRNDRGSGLEAIRIIRERRAPTLSDAARDDGTNCQLIASRPRRGPAKLAKQVPSGRTSTGS